MNKRTYLSPPHMGGNEMAYVKEAFDTNWIAPLGANVDAFEQELCSHVGAKFGLALSSGTAGVHLALRYLGVEPGDLVFCSSLTFSGSCNPIMYQYAQPVFIDSEPDSWNMSPSALENALAWAKEERKLPKAVIVVDLYGQSADYERLKPICEYYGVPMIEDAAEALGARYGDGMCGTFGFAGVFSFNGNKIITTSGGGMVVTDDAAAINKMRFWSMQAREPARHYEHKEYGYNYRMSNICAGIGRGQLQILSARIKAKKSIFERYASELEHLPIRMMPISPKGAPNYWLTAITIEQGSRVMPEDVFTVLDQENIESRPVWKPMHLQPVFKDSVFFAHEGAEDVGKSIFDRGICLPSGTSMTADEQERVIAAVKRVFARLDG